MTNTIKAEGRIQTALQRLRHTHPFHAAIAYLFGRYPGKAKTVHAVIGDNEIEIVFNAEAICNMDMDKICRALLRAAKKIIEWLKIEAPKSNEDGYSASNDGKGKGSGEGSGPPKETGRRSVTLEETAQKGKPTGDTGLESDIAGKGDPDSSENSDKGITQKEGTGGKREKAGNEGLELDPDAAGKAGFNENSKTDGIGNETPGDETDKNKGKEARDIDSAAAGKTGLKDSDNKGDVGEGDAPGKPNRDRGNGKELAKDGVQTGDGGPKEGDDTTDKAMQFKSKIQTLIRLAAIENKDAPDAPDQADRRQGNDSNGDEETFISEGNHKLQWKKILSRYQGSMREKIRTRFYPNRRMPHLLGIVQGGKRVFRKPRIMIAIDTSGSVTSKELKIISRECTFFKQTAEVLIVECDSEVQRVYKFKKAITKVKGRGGTSFIPPLETAFLRKHKTELAIYFTDGCGPAPEKPPIVPVIWCLVAKDLKPPVEYGKVVKYDN